MTKTNFEKSSEKAFLKEHQAWQSPQNKKKNFLVNKIVEFCNRTDLHGYKYIVMPELSVFERSCWAVAVVVSIFTAIYFVITAYEWYARNPIVTVIESTHGAIWDVPFPAVTICNLNIISKKRAEYQAKELKRTSNMTVDELKNLFRLAPALRATFKATDEQKESLALLQNVLDENEMSAADLFESLSPTQECSDIVERCMWKNSIIRCDLIFQKILTPFGVCCAFNYFAVKFMDPKSRREAFTTGKPRRVASCGYQTALTVLLTVKPEDYYSALMASYGMMVFVDYAYNFPDMNSPVRPLGPSTELFVAVSPERTYATSGIKSFSPEKRECYYKDEVKLGIFQEYSYHNCMAYRDALEARNACGCVPLFFPLGTKDRPCNFSDLNCLEKYRQSFQEFQSSDDHKHAMECLPDCENFEYPLEIALGILSSDATLKGLSFFKDIPLENRSLLNVFFNDLVSTRYRRDVYFNWQNLLSSFGGLLSLMLGFTLISAFDLLIFFTFRIAYDAVKTNMGAKEIGMDEHHRKKGWAGKNKVYVQEFNRRNQWFQQQDEKVCNKGNVKDLRY